MISLLRVRRRLSRRAGPAALLLSVLALCGAVAGHHEPMDMHGMGQAAEVCLAVIATAAAVVLGIATLARRRPEMSRVLGRSRHAHPPVHVLRPPRAAPLFLRLLVLRR